MLVMLPPADRVDDGPGTPLPPSNPFCPREGGGGGRRKGASASSAPFLCLSSPNDRDRSSIRRRRRNARERARRRRRRETSSGPVGEAARGVLDSGRRNGEGCCCRNKERDLPRFRAVMKCRGGGLGGQETENPFFPPSLHPQVVFFWRARVSKSEIPSSKKYL